MSLAKPYMPQVVDAIRIAFPAGVDDLMPAWEDIPEDFRSDRGDARPWVRFQRDWFYRGLPSSPQARDGIEVPVALRHLKTIQGSWDPSHEYKEAAVAYLASLWFVEPVLREES